MKRNMKRTMAVALSLALAASGMVQAPGADAAAKVKLSASKATIKVGAKKTVTIKGVKASNVKKLTLSNSKKAVATVKKNSKVKFTVTGKKAGKAVVTAKVTLKKAVAKKTSYTLKYTATVKSAAVTEKTVTKFADLESALKTVSVAGGTVTINSTETGSFTIAAGDYSNVDLIVNAPNADVENDATFKSVTIKSIKADTWKEKAKGNSFIFDTSSSTRLVAAIGALINSIVYKSSSSTITNAIEALGEIKDIKVSGGTNVNINASGASSKIDTIEVTDKDAKLDVKADLTSTVSSILLSAAATLKFSGDSANQTLIKKVEGATVTNTAPNVIETTISQDPSASPTPTATATASAAPTPTATAAATPGASENPQGGGISSGSNSGSSEVGLPRTIVFDAGTDGTIDSTSKQTVNFTEQAGATITAPSAKKTGAICIGWSVSDGATIPDFTQGALLTVGSSTTYYAVYSTTTALASTAKFTLAVPTDADLNADNALDSWSTSFSGVAASCGVTGYTKGTASFDEATNTLTIPWTITGTMTKKASTGTSSDWKGALGFPDAYNWAFPVLLSTSDSSLTTANVVSVKAGKVDAGTNAITNNEMDLNLHWSLSGAAPFVGMTAEACHVGAMKVNTVESAYFTVTYANGLKEKHVVTLAGHYGS